jgi:hypothetical protein
MTYQQTALKTWRIHGGSITLEVVASNWVEALGRALDGEIPARMVLEAHGAGGIAISLDGDRWSIFPAVSALTG